MVIGLHHWILGVDLVMYEWQAADTGPITCSLECLGHCPGYWDMLAVVPYLVIYLSFYCPVSFRNKMLELCCLPH